MWRGGVRLGISVAAPFVWRCLNGLTIAPSPHPSHRTWRANFPHHALGQDVTLSSTTRRAQAGSGVRAHSTRRRSVRRLIDLRRLLLGRPNVTALWRVLLLPWIGQWILAGIRSCGQAPRLSRKRACHDDASVQQGQVDNPGATSAPVHLTSCRGTTARNMRDNAPPNERRVRQTAQRAGPAWANTARCCEQ